MIQQDFPRTPSPVYQKNSRLAQGLMNSQRELVADLPANAQRTRPSAQAQQQLHQQQLQQQHINQANHLHTYYTDQTELQVRLHNLAISESQQNGSARYAERAEPKPRSFQEEYGTTSSRSTSALSQQQQAAILKYVYQTFIHLQPIALIYRFYFLNLILTVAGRPMQVEAGLRNIALAHIIRVK